MDRSSGRPAILDNLPQTGWDDEGAHDLTESFNSLLETRDLTAFVFEKNGHIIASGTAYRDIAIQTRRERAKKLIFEGKSDLARWSERPNLEEQWNARAQIVATLITAPATVIDLGCGAMALERSLPESITYLPADLVSRDERTILFDMNNDLFPNADADIAVALGLLEYAHDPAACIKAFARWPRLIMSYNPTDIEDGRDRLKHGWFSNLAVASLINLAKDAGFSLTAMLPCPPAQRIFDFVRVA